MKTVLVVEDSSDLRAIMKMALESEGFGVLMAANGKEALESLKRLDSLPNVILLDLMMPVMSGWEFLEERKKDPRLAEVPVVICSAVQDENLASMKFLKKPPNLTEMVEMVQNTCK